MFQSQWAILWGRYEHNHKELGIVLLVSIAVGDSLGALLVKNFSYPTRFKSFNRSGRFFGGAT